MRLQPALLVLRPLGLGDFLTSVPALRALARAFPNHRHVLALPGALHGLVPLIPQTSYETLDCAPLTSLPESLLGVEVAVNLHGRGPQSHRILLELEPRRLIAFAHAQIAASVCGPVWLAHEHEVLRWCRMLAENGIRADAAELELLAPATAVPKRLRGATILHPGAARIARRWPAERWADVARACLERGERIVLTGTFSERDITREIAVRAGISSSRDLAGKTSLPELAALVACADRVLSGDTGIAHFAAAYRVPSLALFGPIPPGEWGPPDSPRHRAIWHGKRGDPHGNSVDSGLLAITSAQVNAELERLPANVP